MEEEYEEKEEEVKEEKKEEEEEEEEEEGTVTATHPELVLVEECVVELDDVLVLDLVQDVDLHSEVRQLLDIIFAVFLCSHHYIWRFFFLKNCENYLLGASC